MRLVSDLHFSDCVRISCQVLNHQYLSLARWFRQNTHKYVVSWEVYSTFNIYDEQNNKVELLTNEKENCKI